MTVQASPEDKMTYRVVLRDSNKRTYSAPCELHGTSWFMRTSDGLQPIEYFFDDDSAGRLTFDSYRGEGRSPRRAIAC
jgi:hypothetical protein